MNKWIVVALIVVAVVGGVLFLYRHDLPIWKDIWAYHILPVISPTWNMLNNVIAGNKDILAGLGGIGTPILGGLLVKSIQNIGHIKTWATDKITALTHEKNNVTSEVYQLQQSFLGKEQDYQDQIEQLQGALNDANPMITSLQTDLTTMTKQYEDARLQLQTLHEFQQKIDTEQIGKILADAQRVK